jgi:hypothetical protein
LIDREHFLQNYPYDVNVTGVVRSKHDWQIVKPCMIKQGYLVVHLRDITNKRKTHMLHTLVMSLFAPPPFSSTCRVKFLDSDKTNCQLSNLEWTDEPKDIPPEALARMDEARKGALEKVMCPVCKKMITPRGMGKWHLKNLMNCYSRVSHKKRKHARMWLLIQAPGKRAEVVVKNPEEISLYLHKNGLTLGTPFQATTYFVRADAENEAKKMNDDREVTGKSPGRSKRGKRDDERGVQSSS